MEINEVAALKVRELPAAADRKGICRRVRERGGGKSKANLITPLLLSLYLSLSLSLRSHQREVVCKEVRGQSKPC